MNKWLNRGAHLTREKCPSGSKEQTYGQEKKKRQAVQGEGPLALPVFARSVLSLADTGAGRRISGQPSQNCKEIVLVIQPETQQMWEEKVWAA